MREILNWIRNALALELGNKTFSTTMNNIRDQLLETSKLRKSPHQNGFSAPG